MKKLTARLFALLLMLSVVMTPVIAIFRSTPVNALPGSDNPSDSNVDDPRGEPSQPSDSSLNQPSRPQDEDQDQNEDENNPDDNQDNEDETNEDEEDEEPVNICKKKSGAISWIICPFTNWIGSIIDDGLNVISGLFEIDVISTEDDSPVYLVWRYARNITNIVVVIFLLIVIYSQLTGLGINNYGIKRVLPRIIIAIILVNLSFIICTIVIDISNILGNSLRQTFTSLETPILGDADTTQLTYTALVGTFLGGATIGILASFAGGLGSFFFMLLPILISGAISVLIGLITIAARQALVSLLVMIAPLAFIAYLLPNTEKWFIRWRDLLLRMLIFYPMFSFLIGASRLLGYALILAANNPFSIIIGFGVQVIPLFFAFSLMKMSGTILGTLNDKLNRLASPLNTTAAGWAGSHAERRRQHTIANSRMPGARLRRYLDYKKNLRDADTENSLKTRQSIAAERTFNRLSSFKGQDKNGNDVWKKRANRFTRNAKMASYRDTRSATAREALENTLNQYGDHFGTTKKQNRVAQALTATGRANALSSAHAEAFKDNMKQKFLTTNNAQADQEYLLNQYISAANGRYDKTGKKEFNRLIANASGSLGHLGEASIMGQVIAESSRIEQRRRQEARIIANKFGIKKPEFRGMVFDCEYINDDGYETDADGNELHDSQYRFYKGKKHSPWKQFIAVHKETSKEITSTEYNALSPDERKLYNRINYMDITDAKGKPVGRVYADDAGYMKELIADDVNIGDPINRRYLTEVGRALTDKELTELQEKYHVEIPKNFENKNGHLYRYRTTITNALLTSKYKEHAAEVTPMITAQSNNGYNLNIAHYNIANLDSLTKASKSGSFLQNDAYAIHTWIDLINSVNSTEEGKRFEDFFPDEDIATYRNVNGLPLHGLRLINGKWEKIERTNPNITLEDRKNFVKHQIIPNAAKKLAGMFNRRISPNILDGQKPDSLAALVKLVEALSAVGIQNADPNLDISQKLNPEIDIFSSVDPGFLQYAYRQIQSSINRIRNGEDISDIKDNLNETLNFDQGNPGTSSNNSSNSNTSGSSSSSSGQSSSSSNGSKQGTTTRGNKHQKSSSPKKSGHSGIDAFNAAIDRANQRSARNDIKIDKENIAYTIESICTSYTNGYESAAEQLYEFFASTPPLDEHLGELHMIIDEYRDEYPDSTQDSINQTTGYHDEEEERLNNLCQAVLELARSILYGD